MPTARNTRVAVRVRRAVGSVWSLLRPAEPGQGPPGDEGSVGEPGEDGLPGEAGCSKKNGDHW